MLKDPAVVKNLPGQQIRAAYLDSEPFAKQIKKETDDWEKVHQDAGHQGGLGRAYMYNLHLSAEQLEFRDTVRDFVDDEVKPVTLKADRLDLGDRSLPVEVLRKASQMGLRTLALPEELGGVGADALTCCIVTEELAVGDTDVAAVLAETSALGRVLFAAMTPEQRERFLRGVPGGRRLSPGAGLPRAGRRQRARHQLPPARRRTCARRHHRDPRRRAIGSSTAPRTASPTRRSPS